MESSIVPTAGKPATTTPEKQHTVLLLLLLRQAVAAAAAAAIVTGCVPNSKAHSLINDKICLCKCCSINILGGNDA